MFVGEKFSVHKILHLSFVLIETGNSSSKGCYVCPMSKNTEEKNENSWVNIIFKGEVIR